MSTLSSHVLDTSLGKPAAGIRVTLQRADGTSLGEYITDADGRVKGLGSELAEGAYRLRFDVAAYFFQGNRETFYEEIVIAFRVSREPHYHVPLLVSPFGYTTYRGS